MMSEHQSFAAHTLERSASSVLLNSATLCCLHLPNLAWLSIIIILKEMQWEGMGYSHINSKDVWKLFHLSMKLEWLEALWKKTRIWHSRRMNETHACKIQTGR